MLTLPESWGSSEIQAFGGLLALLVVGMITRRESRALMSGIVAVVLVPDPVSLIVVAVLIVVSRAFDAVKVL